MVGTGVPRIPGKIDRKIKLIKSTDESPEIILEAAQKLEVVDVSIMEPGKSTGDAIAATLCGYGSTYCIALIET